MRPAPAPASAEPDTCAAFEQFLRRVERVQTAPYVLMLGEMCGANVSFMGERGFRVCMEKDVRRATEGPFAGALLWDALSLMPPEESRRRAALLLDLLEEGGAALALFDAPSPPAASPLSRYRIVSESRVATEKVPGRLVRRHPYQNGEIVRVFEGFDVELLQMRRSGRRDALFFKARSS